MRPFKGFDPLKWIEKKEVKKMDLFIQYAIAASQFFVLFDKALGFNFFVPERGGDVNLPWLIGTARHKLVDHWRRPGRQRDQRGKACILHVLGPQDRDARRHAGERPLDQLGAFASRRGALRLLVPTDPAPRDVDDDACLVELNIEYTNPFQPQQLAE